MAQPQGLYAALAMGLGTAALTLVAGLEISASFTLALVTMAVAALAGLMFLPFIRAREPALATVEMEH